GLRVTNLDLSRANPEYSAQLLRQLFQWDLTILTPRNEFETFWDTAEGLMVVTIFLGIIATVFSVVVALPLSFLGARNIMSANRFQVIWTAVLPQIVNPYISFTIYRLDTNVRLAPILGLVGGGGIGILLFQSINLLQYGAAGLIIFMIVITVAAMDFASAQIRRRLL